MSDVIELSKELRKELDKHPLVIEYLRYKELVENSSELKSLKEEIKKSINDPNKKKTLLDKYNSHPLVVNYNSLKIELNDFLSEICQIINKK